MVRRSWGRLHPRLRGVLPSPEDPQSLKELPVRPVRRPCSRSLPSGHVLLPTVTPVPRLHSSGGSPETPRSLDEGHPCGATTVSRIPRRPGRRPSPRQHLCRLHRSPSVSLGHWVWFESLPSPPFLCSLHPLGASVVSVVSSEEVPDVEGGETWTVRGGSRRVPYRWFSDTTATLGEGTLWDPRRRTVGSTSVCSYVSGVCTRVCKRACPSVRACVDVYVCVVCVCACVCVSIRPRVFGRVPVRVCTHMEHLPRLRTRGEKVRRPTVGRSGWCPGPYTGSLSGWGRGRSSCRSSAGSRPVCRQDRRRPEEYGRGTPGRTLGPRTTVGDVPKPGGGRTQRFMVEASGGYVKRLERPQDSPSLSGPHRVK